MPVQIYHFPARQKVYQKIGIGRCEPAEESRRLNLGEVGSSLSCAQAVYADGRCGAGFVTWPVADGQFSCACGAKNTYNTDCFSISELGDCFSFGFETCMVADSAFEAPLFGISGIVALRVIEVTALILRFLYMFY